MRASGLMELEAVVAVARYRNFRAAAVELGRSRSAVSHTVAALEQRLRVKLFNRTTRSVSLTEAGEAFVATVASALAEIHAAFESASSRRTSLGGILRIKTFDDVAQEMIAPIVLQYLRRYPEMKVDVVTNGHPADITVDGFDAGVRRADDVPQGMIAVPLSYELRMAVVGSLAYLENRRKPHIPKDLLAQTIWRDDCFLEIRAPRQSHGRRRNWAAHARRPGICFGCGTSRRRPCVSARVDGGR
jgi:DNA-binding transcriptional LysR family regulator